MFLRDGKGEFYLNSSNIYKDPASFLQVSEWLFKNFPEQIKLHEEIIKGILSHTAQLILLEYRQCKKKHIPLLLLPGRENKFELRSFASGEWLNSLSFQKISN